MTARHFQSEVSFYADLAHAEQLRISTIPGLQPMTQLEKQECWALYNRAKEGDFRILGRNKMLLRRKLSKNFGFTYGASSSMLFAADTTLTPEEEKFYWQHTKDAIQRNKVAEVGKPYQQARLASSHSIIEQSRVQSPDYITGKGAILATDNWSVLGNDAIILGTMHSALDQHCPYDEASVQFCVDESSTSESFLRNPMSYVWNDVAGPNFWNKCITVTGRELLGLTLFGYSFKVYKGQQDILGLQFNIDSHLAYQNVINSSFTQYHHLVHNLQKNKNWVKRYFSNMIGNAQIEQFRSPQAQSSWRAHWAKRFNFPMFSKNSRRVHPC